MNDSEIEKGYKITFENARKLIEEADGLKLFERFSRAYSLYQLAIEEIGKCIILFRALLDFYLGKSINKDYLDSMGFFNHKKKTRESLISELFAIISFEKSTGKETNLKQKIFDDYNSVHELNNKKNQSLYVDIIDDKFKSPDSIITKEMVDDISTTAHIRLKAIEPFLRPLIEMKEIAKKLDELTNNPEKVKEIEQKYAS